MTKSITSGRATKSVRIYRELRAAILQGQYPFGQKVPSETVLTRKYDVSRPTVARALAELEAEHMVVRKAGSGTYVAYRQQEQGLLRLGLLVPGLGETEVFEVICAQIADLAHENNYDLIWNGIPVGDGEQDRTKFEDLVDRYIEQRVDGIFFVPLRTRDDEDPINVRIAEKLTRAGTAVVLLDRDAVSFPRRSPYDLVEIDNFQAGYAMTGHLLERGARRIDFLMWPHGPNTIRRRVSGYQSALHESGRKAPDDWIHTGNPDDAAFVGRVLAGHHADAYLCDNDTYAAQFMHTLKDLGIRIPADVRVTGFDDVSFATHLRVPLTTFHQPCRDLGKVAVETMLARIPHPKAPPRTVQLCGHVVVRKST